ncbi:flagellar hook-associated protein FlgK [Sphingomonas sp. AOB5]|uniref:flagellar hook-associated protein FlgK n=1 Tax=Sphingomonas sp. AOB5 TaxID=3034017 RepID=UPI0023F8DF65|nr:flagellar hook-associated protein FlgK [Sphingomonas sp. AOB5]MDF7777520.1 flagellar hook-associated protein FlgK [Sphingomonas sp. AOB5]
MSDMLSIGASGVRAYQTALTTVSENIANAGNTNYARRTANLKEVIATSATSGSSITGLGVVANGVVRQGDDLRAGDVRNAGADLAKTEAGATWLERIEGALTGNQLGDRLTSFFNNATAVAADPSALAPRATMLESAASLATAFSSTSDALAGAAADLDATAEAAVGNLNSLLSGLAKINSAIGRTPQGTSGSAALMDQRDQILGAMSAITDVSVSLDVNGRATVRAGGDGGPVLVRGDQAATITYVQNDEGAMSFAVHGNGETQVMTPMGGALAGMAEGAQRIAAAREQLDAMATSFVDGVNAVQAGGVDLSGNSGAPMFEAGDPPSQIKMVLTDPRGIAAASTGGGSRDNSNLANLTALRSSGGYETGLTDLVSTNAAALSARRTVASAQTAIRDSAVAAHASATGVNVDEEAVDLIRFQQAYQASSRVIQIARETLQSILDIR